VAVPSRLPQPKAIRLLYSCHERLGFLECLGTEMRMDAALKASAARNEALPPIAVIREDVFIFGFSIGRRKLDNCVRCL
jgi:hypothetical protein